MLFSIDSVMAQRKKVNNLFKIQFNNILLYLAEMGSMLIDDLVVK